jgi:hypothetical protein
LPTCAGTALPTRRGWRRAKRSSLRAAIRAAKGGSNPIHFILQADAFVSTADIDYHDGERFPALERVGVAPAYLDDIIKPLTPQEKAPEEPKKDAD